MALFLEHFVEKAAIFARMACGTYLFNHVEKRVEVAVGGDGYDFLGVTRRFALHPDFISAAAPIRGFLGFQC